MGENADIARRFVDAYERVSFEEAQRVCDAEVELTTLYDQPGRPGFRGHDGLRAWFERTDRLWAFIRVVTVTFEEVGDWVLVGGTARVRGRASPHELDLEFFSAAKAVDGRFVKLGLYVNRDDAVAAIEAD